MSAAVTELQRGQRRTGPVLESLPTGARTTGEDAAARSRMVRRMRVILPTIAIVLVAAFVINTGANNRGDAFLNDFEDITATPEELHVSNPRFTGIDDRGRPFEITADNMSREAKGGDSIELVLPRAVQGADDDATIVTAETGVYQTDAQVLKLVKDVTLEHTFADATYLLKAPAATLAVNKREVTTDGAVTGSASDGSRLSADRMSAFHDEGRVVFEGNVSMRIYPKSAKAAGVGDARVSENGISGDDDAVTSASQNGE